MADSRRAPWPREKLHGQTDYVKEEAVKSTRDKDLINSQNVASLVTKVEEAARSTEEGVRHFIEPAEGTLERAVSRRHHIVFGRRGSGKSSLLRKAAADLTIDRRPIAYVNLESFKGHSYPDVLLSVLLETLQGFKKWLDTAAINPANKTSFWGKLFGSTPSRPILNKRNCKNLSERIGVLIDELRSQLHAPEEAELKLTTTEGEDTKTGNKIGGSLSNPVAHVTVEAADEARNTYHQAKEQQYKEKKIDFLHRHILDYQRIFSQMADLSDGDCFLFLDDLYYIKRNDQPSVVDYFHRIGKDHGLWLKVGTIRQRSEWYRRGDPSVGIKLGDDADSIDLDITLEKYAIARGFLRQILAKFAEEAGVELAELMTDGAFDRLVLASGGVARDFLSVFRMSVGVARERLQSADKEHDLNGKITAEDVNVAAGEYDAYKREDFKRDTDDDQEELQEEFEKLKTFCLDTTKANCFLVDKDAKGRDIDLIHELVDLKLFHLVRSRVTVSGRTGRIYEAYMLDLSQYAGARKRRGVEIIEFWKGGDPENLRRKTLIFPDPGLDR
jgi:hypothetical protein